MKITKLSSAFYEGKAQKIRFTLAIAATLLIAALDVSVSWILQQVLDAATGNDKALSLTQLALIFVLLLVLYLAGHVILYHTKPKFISNAIEKYKNVTFRLITKKRISAFSKENTAVYISALSNDAQTVEKNILQNIFPLVENCLLFFGAFALMIFYSPLLTVIAVLFSVFPVISSLIIGNRLEEAEKQVSDKSSGYTASLKESLEGFSVIKSFKAERQLSRVIEESNRKMQDAKCKRDKLLILIATIGQLSGIITQFGVFFVSAFLALSGKGITPGIIVAFVQLMNYVIAPIARVPQIISEMNSGTVLIGKLSSALEENYDEGDKTDIEHLEKGISLHDLSFSYEEGKEVLHNISFTFDKGKSYAIVGGSGSGKSTLLSLLTASSSDYSGSITYDGNEMRNISSESLYDTVSMISQNVFIFNSTLKNNITMFSDVDENSLNEAVRLSGLSEFQKEKGDDYICGENGNALSGGERQRISIARSLLRKSQVLLADEATASLDKENAAHIINSLLGLDGLTRIVVTHSLEKSQLEKYDCIIALKDGRITESGTFGELMDKKAYFYSLYTVSQ